MAQLKGFASTMCDEPLIKETYFVQMYLDDMWHIFYLQKG